MSPPTDRRSASGDVLDPPFGRDGHPASPNGHRPGWGDDFWDDSGPVGRVDQATTDHGAPGRGRGRGGTVLPTRRWPRRILIGVNIVVAMMLVATGTVYGYFNWRFNQIHKISIPSINGGSGAAGAPMNILVVGSDSRANDNGPDAKQFGSASQVGGQRSDTLMVVHVEPSSGTATLMSIPRDLWVPIPGKNFSQRINTTFDSGPDLLVQTIKQDLGIGIDHYVEVDFQSFRDVVNAVGGVKEYFPTPARDAYSLLNIPAAGCYSMTGDMALSFVRARHYEYKVNGRWVSEAESDLARIKRQQSFIKKMMAKAQGSGLTNPLELNSIIGGVTKNLTLDRGFSQGLLLSLGKRFRSLSPDSLPTATLPTTQAVIGGADVLLLQQPQAGQAIADFMRSGHAASTTTTDNTSGTTSSVLPSSVQVAVLNGTGRPGEASKAGTDLTKQGFVVTSSHSANNFSYTSSVIRYRPGNDAKARLLASAVRGSSVLQEDSSIQGADVELITGQSFLGISNVTANATPATSASGNSGSATTTPATPPTTTYELPGTPTGFVPPSC